MFGIVFSDTYVTYGLPSKKLPSRKSKLKEKLVECPRILNVKMKSFEFEFQKNKDSFLITKLVCYVHN